MRFSIKDFFSKCDQTQWSHLLKNSLMETSFFVQWEILRRYVSKVNISTKTRSIRRLSEKLSPKRFAGNLREIIVSAVLLWIDYCSWKTKSLLRLFNFFKRNLRHGLK